MKRRTLLQGGAALAAAAALGRPGVVRAASATTLTFVPYADLALLDPLSAALVTRTHAMMVYDGLFGLDDAGQAQPQMLAGYTVEDEGKRWVLTLRDGLMFHDGTPVLARDAVASLARWMQRDGFGQSLAAATDEFSAPSDKVVQFRLKQPFPMLPYALSQPNAPYSGIMPARLAATPPTTQVTEIVGSGPFRFLPGERVPGARNVYAKFDGYVPRADGTPSFAAGPRIAHFERVVWQTMPDPATQIAALQAGEVDWVEQPIMDMVPTLKRDPTLKLMVVEANGLIGTMRLNQLHPPFDNPAIRRIVLRAVRQRDYMEAVAGDDRSVWNDQVGFFTPGSPFASDAGMAALDGSQEPQASKQALAEAGYKGERVVFLGAADVPRINAICQVGADMLRGIGFNVDYVAADWGTVVQRSLRKQPVDQGGWSALATFFTGITWMNPAENWATRANGNGAYVGWPDLPELEALRTAWLAAPDETEQKRVARAFQARAFEDVPTVPLGLYYQPSAFRADLTGIQRGTPQFAGIRRV